MLEFIELLIHFGTTVFKLLQPGGVKLVMAETIVMKQQLIVLNRYRKRAPSLVTSDRLLFGLLAVLISERRLQKVAVILKPATVLAFHKALLERIYSRLSSNKTKRIPGREPQSVFRLWSHFDANI
ncbi:MAG: putative transposase [Patiriisocius sp.]|jgi:putative transposase